MRTWKWVEPRDPANDDWSGVDCFASDDYIVQHYWPQWLDRMIKLGRGQFISFDNCIVDFAVGHWAVQVAG